MMQEDLIVLASLLGVIALGGAGYYALRWYFGVAWWLGLLMVPVAITVFILIDIQDASGFDGLLPFVFAAMVTGPISIGGLIGGLIAGRRKRRRNG